MEESAQRRERLKAMRMEASQEASTNNNMSDHSAVSLSNPLVESTANTESQVQPFAQSFNYYTDPMAAYSGNKQRSKVSPQISHDYSSNPQRPWSNEAFPSPSFRPHINHSPNQRMQQPQGQYANPNYAYTSNPPQGGNFPSPSPGGYHGPQSFGYPSPQPHFTSGPNRGYPSPRFTNSPAHGSGRGYPSPGPGPHFRNSPNHGPGQGGYPNTGPYQGRGQWSGNSMGPGPSYGRGRGGGRGRGRGGAHDHASAEHQPDRFYSKSMVEDPWKFLEPVIWKSNKKQWIPHSVSAKKPRVLESPKQSSSQPSLAEILAASFNEAASDEPNKE